MSRRYLAGLSVALVLLPLLVGCSVPSITTITQTFSPSLILTGAGFHHKWNSFFTCSYSGGLQLVEPAPAGEVYAGFIRSYDGGFCWEQVGWSYGVVIQYDLSELSQLDRKLVISARLVLRERVVTMRAGNGEAMRSGGTEGCLGAWIQPDEDPLTGNPWAATGEYTPQGRSGDVYQVTGLVSSWVTRPSDNTGILLRGDETNISAEDNAACVSALSGFELTIQYQVFPS